MPTGGAGEVDDLALAARGGSLVCYGELVERLETRVVAFLLRRTRDRHDAEDLAQDAFVRAWQRIDEWDPSRAFGAWVLTIAARLAKDRARAAGRRSARERAHGPADRAVGPDPSHAVAEREQLGRLWAAADRDLSEDQRSALWLRYAEGMGVGDIATVLGKTRVGVRVALFRARRTLVERLDEDRVGDGPNAAARFGAGAGAPAPLDGRALALARASGSRGARSARTSGGAADAGRAGGVR